MNILMVCMGNICRSPMAAKIGQNIARDVGKTYLHFDSAGTHGYHIGEPAHHLANKVMINHGSTLSHHRARKFRQEDFSQFDIIMTADEQNFRAICSLSDNPKDIQKVIKMLKMHPSLSNTDVPDPYYGGIDDFEHVYQLLHSALSELVVSL